MSNEQLTAYLKDESYLYSLSYEELKTLVVEYPYASNLRILLLKKSYIDKNRDYERNLQMAAAYTTNRRHLYKIVQKLKTLQNAPENVILGEDYLELTELSNIEKMLQERHVSEVFNEKRPLSESKSSVQWGGIEFEDAANTYSSGASSDDIHFDSLESANLNKAFEFVEPPELTIPVSDNKDVFDSSSELHVDLAIESIMAEFGSVALDLTGSSHKLNGEMTILSEKDTVSENISFEHEDILEEELSLEKNELEADSSVETWNEIPPEPLNVSDQDPEFLSIPLENDNEREDNELHYFEELEDKSEVIQENAVNYVQNNTNLQVFDLESLDSKSINDFQDEDAIIENVLKQIPKPTFLSDRLNIPFPSSVESESQPEINMKKREIDIEIVNNSKAKVIENELPKHENVPAVSFTEWLRQFKVAAPKMPNVEVLPIQKEKKNVEIISKTTEPTEMKHVLNESVVALLFEKPSDLPDNLFGFNSLKSVKESNEKLDLDDSADNLEDIFAVKKKKKKKYMHELAAKSIEENNDLMSETLADLLAWQGNNKKAIEMYAKLCLQFPEKSDYFAAKIEKLRNTD